MSDWLRIHQLIYLVRQLTCVFYNLKLSFHIIIFLETDLSVSCLTFILIFTLFSHLNIFKFLFYSFSMSILCITLLCIISFLNRLLSVHLHFLNHKNSLIDVFDRLILSKLLNLLYFIDTIYIVLSIASYYQINKI